MDQGLKERLIGAAVLVALGVWLIPWLLDGSDDANRAPEPDLELPVPGGPAAQVRTEVIDLEAPHPPIPAGAAAAPPISREAAAPLATGAGPTRASNVSGSQSESRVAEESAAAHSAAARSAAARSAGAAAIAAKPASNGGSRSEPSPAAPRAEGDWAIQLGSFGEEDNARRLAARVANYGDEPRISTFKADGRVMYRVRLGPYATRARAEAAVSALSVHGFVAQVVTAD
jgi:DedD protein